MKFDETIILEETNGLTESEPQHSPVGDSSVESSPIEFANLETNSEVDASALSPLGDDDAEVVAMAQTLNELLNSDSVCDQDKAQLNATLREMCGHGSALTSATIETNNGDETFLSPPPSREAAEFEVTPLEMGFATKVELAAAYAEEAENRPMLKSALDALKPFEDRTDAWLAEQVVDWCGEGIVNCGGVGILAYNGTYWRAGVDGVLRLYVEKVLTCLSGHVASNRAEYHQWLRKCCSKNGMKAIIEEVKARAKLISIHNLDSDPLLFNVANGTLNLATGKLQPHDPNDLITRLSPVAYDVNAKCPLFKQAVLRICNNDPELMRYVQKVLGYVLTGLTTEQCLFLFIGDGANGKSLFLELIQKILGTYHQHTPASTFLRTTRNSSCGLSELCGARMVTLSEFNRGERWNEALLKSATGDAHLTATFSKTEEITFTPHFKLFMVSNHKPKFEGAEHGLWRRFRLIECRNRFWDASQGETGLAELEADKMLAVKLEGELSGILNWAIEGYVAWRNEGLQSPPTVQEDNQNYRRENDSLAQFIEDEVEFASTCRMPKSDFYENYSKWASKNGFAVLPKNDVGKQLVERGIGEAKSGGTRFWQGLSLKEPMEIDGEEVPAS